MSSLMHAVVLTGFGGPEKLIYTQVPRPIPKAGEVLIQVGASSVNNTDLNTRTGWYGAESQFQGLLQDTSVNDVNKIGELATTAKRFHVSACPRR